MKKISKKVLAVTGVAIASLSMSACGSVEINHTPVVPETSESSVPVAEESTTESPDGSGVRITTSPDGAEINVPGVNITTSPEGSSLSAPGIDISTTADEEGSTISIDRK